MLISENVPIKNLVTMRIGGPAKYVIEIKSKDEIPEAYQFAAEKNLPVTILGNGANTFATDEGYQGVSCSIVFSASHSSQRRKLKPLTAPK